MENKISKKDVQRIIREEIALAKQANKKFSLEKLDEALDHSGIVAVTRSAGDLLKAVNKFEEKATEPMKSALVGALPQLKKFLEQMLQVPGSYVPPGLKKVVKLRAEKSKKTS